MARVRSPIKVPCENEDLLDQENAPDYQGVSQTQNETLGLPYGSSNLQDKRGFGPVPRRNNI